MSPVALQRHASRRGLQRAEMPAPAQRVRAAVYCRKSTDENLNSDFNSLDAQREACQAFVAAMRSEGWIALPHCYEDAAFSGGTTDRPALQQLLNDIETGTIDAVVVVKIDRLSRSLLQFLQLMEFFEKHGTAFCAVTQQINTATSAGRLLVNVLMSFAQFERELGSERTREKIHAARKKGRWIGGPPLLGFDIDRVNHRLVVNQQEAVMVRELFDLYLQRRTLLAVAHEVNSRGWIKKQWVSGSGQTRGGASFDKVYLQRLLTNPVYIGKVTLHGEIFDGLQEAIVDETTFREVDRLLRANRNGQGNAKPTRHDALLRGIIRCSSCGCAMGHHWTKRHQKLYRYYRCINEIKRGRHTCPTPALSAGEIELFVTDQIRRVARDPELAEQVFQEAAGLQITETKRLKSEQQRLQKQKVQRDEESKRLVSSLGVGNTQSEAVCARLNAIGEETQKLTQRLTELAALLQAGGDGSVNLQSVTAALSEFDALWDILIPRERERLIHAIIERVDCSPNNEIQVVFRTAVPTAVSNVRTPTTPPQEEGKGESHAAVPNAAIGL